jgi:O-antigen ligase
MFIHTVAVGLFSHPNAFGGFVFWPFLVCVGLILIREKRRWGLCGAAFFGVSLLLSYYRTMIIGAGLALFFLLVLRWRLAPRKKIIIFGSLGLAGAAAAVLLYLNLADTLFLKNFLFRVWQWWHAVQVIQSSPWILWVGAGIVPIEAQMNLSFVDPHNAFLYMVLHYGVPGLALYLAIIGVLIAKARVLFSRGTTAAHPILSALWCGWVVWFLTSSVDSRLTTPGWQFLFILIAAIFLEGCDMVRRSNEPKAVSPNIPM